jgi:hypothetical protein
MAPRPGIEPDDVVTPREAGRRLEIDPRTISVWIHRYGLQPLGKLGRWNAYDFREIAAIEAALRGQQTAA